MHILGISAFYHDSAAALLVDGRIVAAAQEERFTRRKHDPAFPANAIHYCLAEAKIAAGDIDHVVFYEKPFLKFERLLETYLAFAPRGFQSFRKAMPVWLKQKLFQKGVLRDALRDIDGTVDWEAKLLFADHHQSHAASAFFASPFTEAAILTLDGVGEWTTTSAGYGRDNTLELGREINFPHSIGLLYSAFTYHLGFKVNSGEYKVMGLAPYGEPKYARVILDHLIDLKDDGTFRLDLSYFDYCTGLTMTNGRFDALFGGKPRDPSTELLEQRHMDLAASLQHVTEEIVLRLTRSLAREQRSDNLCLAGGVALNCVANGKILRDGAFKQLWVQPAAGDAGGAVGAALAAYHQFAGRPRVAANHDAMQGGYLGPSFAPSEIRDRLRAAGAVFTELDDTALIQRTVKALVAEKAVGWFQGRMEFGPRALGARSILGDPRSPTMQSSLNLRVKFRESFRPFAPAVLREDVADWFALDRDSPYMQLVADVLERRRLPVRPEDRALFGIDRLNIPRSQIPAVTHVDYSARIQTVHPDTNARFHELLTAFKAATGCPVLVNTSFNVRGEPIVCTPEDAFRCFMGSDIETLVVGNCFLDKEDQPAALKLDYKNAFELD
ncbi:carbamoyltransferase [Bradyrhizobium genosp. L]|uniref:carbamoyltransferase family protein n=1 Tax=Bradyrhizobium genosp. L TaxID=83637 RepID=UPI0018A2AF2B|nr:carbamoyltransferase [Bradyrhizobium genosp. L]QPF87459.1 carbamoyltransferase [Bradyrhizobium genosp. L]